MLDSNEEFVLQEREGARKHRTMRLFAAASLVALCFTFGSIYQCGIHSNEIDAEIDKLRLEAFTECVNQAGHLVEAERLECERSYYPQRIEATEQRKIEKQRAQQVEILYKHCTDQTEVPDQNCDDQVEELMDEVKVK